LHSSIDDKGKIERFFRTLRAAVLAHLTPAATMSLDTLNRTLWAFVEGEYHRAPHRGLDGRTPLDQWALAGANVRYPDPGADLDDLFLFEARRRVMKDRTVSLNGRLYEVDAHLVGQLVTLRYDPDAPPSRPIEVVHDAKCCSPLYLVGTPRELTGLFRRRITWDDGAIREALGGEVAFPMNDCC